MLVMAIPEHHDMVHIILDPKEKCKHRHTLCLKYKKCLNTIH